MPLRPLRLLTDWLGRSRQASQRGPAWQSGLQSPRPPAGAARVEELEPRLLYSAELNPLLAAALVPAGAAEVRLVNPTAAAASPGADGLAGQVQARRHEIVFVDANVADAQALVDALLASRSPDAEVEVVQLLGHANGLQQISAVLADEQGLDAVHIVSHGSAGQLLLGNGLVDTRQLQQQADAVAGWARAMTGEADLLLWGCDVATGSAGRQFTSTLARLTGADVAASTDTTGAASRGGDWQLEWQSGSVAEAELQLVAARLAGWDGTLGSYTVSNLNDSGAGSLRQAITDANANGGADSIGFSTFGSIHLSSALPAVTGQVSINGTNAGTPGIVLDGGGSIATGLQLNAGAANSTVRGLVVQNFSSHGIRVIGASGVTIAGNYVGTNATATAAAGNAIGIDLFDALGAVVGGSVAADRNVISGNTNIGLNVVGSGAGVSQGVVVKGNYIGTTANGAGDLGNTWHGIFVNAGSNVVLGGTGAGDGNVVSGNGSAAGANGITLYTDASSVTVQGNTVGLNAAGTGVLANTGVGIKVSGAGNTIGGTSSGARNVVSGNATMGIQLTGAAATGNTVLGNFIGTGSNGTTDLGNTEDGIQIDTGASGNTIGGTASGARNIIAGNNNAGIAIDDAASNGNQVLGNWIGVGSNGSTLLANSHNGININGATGTVIGDGTTSGRNVVTANSQSGVGITDGVGTVIKGNWLVYNGWDGITLNGASTTGTVIGGATYDSGGNLIAYNGFDGILVTAGASASNAAIILANSIHSNGERGIDLIDGGYTANDAGDADTGPNGLQNYPVLGSVTTATTGTTFVGSLNSTANASFRIDFYTNTYINPEGANGEGERWLGSATVTTDGSGNANFNTALANVWVNNGDKVSATATRDLGGGSYGGTSEFAANVMASTTGVVVVDTSSEAYDTGVTIGTVTISSLSTSRGTDAHISLREALAAVNNTANGAAADRVVFAIAPNIESGNINTALLQPTVTLTSALTTMTQAVVIDASSQPGFAGTPLVQLRGNGAVASGITLAAGATGSTVRGLVIGNFSTAGINVTGGNTHTIAGNWIGLGTDGATVDANGRGVILSNSTGSTIGGLSASDRNVVSGNAAEQLLLDGAVNSHVYGNYVGTDATGTLDPNGTSYGIGHSGISLVNASTGNQIGDTLAGARNLVSGNNWVGVDIASSSATGNTISGNYIGTTASGLAALPNASGISFWSAGSGNSAVANVVSGNANNGVAVGNASQGAKVQGNTIGLGADGSTVVGNGGAGIEVYSASVNTLIGTNADGSNDASEGNVVSGNSVGILVHDAGTTGTQVKGNLIGTDAGGTLDRGNLGDGLRINGSASNLTIGGTSSVQRNVISGNAGIGISANAASVTILGNHVGVNAAGTAALGNDSYGIDIGVNGTNATIGGAAAGAGNVVSGNGNAAVLFEVGSTGTVKGNRIGTNAAGSSSIAGIGAGIWLATSNVQVGGTAAGEGNTISGSDTAGIVVGNGTAGNALLGNAIHGNAGLGIDLALDGVTANDLGDADTGANDLQNYPVLASAVTNGSSTVTINGRLNTGASGYYRVEFFASPTGDGSGQGEGQTYLGYTNVATDASGNGAFAATLSATVPAGYSVSATATASNAGYSAFTSTSEFALNAIAMQPQPPANTVPAAQSTNEDTAKVFSSGNGNAITITDSDAGGSNNQVTISVTHGTLTLAGTAGLSFTAGDGTADATMTLRGTAAAINTALDGLAFSPTADYNGGAVLTIATKDSVLLSLDIDSSLLGRYAFENTGNPGQDSSPAAGHPAATVGVTAVVDGTRGKVVSLDGTSNSNLQVSGLMGSPATVTLAAWVNLASADASGSEVISMGDRVGLRLDQGGNLKAFYADSGGHLFTETAATLAGTGWHHVAYTLNPAGGEQVLYLDGVAVAATAYGSAISWAGGGSATVIGTHGNGGSTSNFNGLIDDARIYNRALTAQEIAVLANDLAMTDTDTVAVTVNAVNDTPAITTSGGSLAYAEGDAATVVDSGLVVTDPDGSLAGATVTISANYDSAGDALLFADQSGITGSFNTATGVLTLTGTATVAQYQTALRTVRFINPSDVPGTAARTVSFEVNDGNASSAVGNRGINVAAIDDAPTFQSGTGKVTTGVVGANMDFVNATAVQADGKIVLAGYTQGADRDFALVRYNADGTLDTSFGGGTGIVTTSLGGDETGQSLAVLGNGQIVLAGSVNSDFALLRYNADGTLDTSFGGGDGVVTQDINGFDEGYALAVQPDGKLLVAGRAGNLMGVARFLADGALDTGFGSSGQTLVDFGAASNYGYDLLLQADGKIVLAGAAFNGTSNDAALARLTSAGALDTSFNGSGKLLVDIGTNSSDTGYAVAQQADGKLVMTGWSNASGSTDFFVIRVTTAGALDSSFSGDGKATYDFGGSSDLGTAVVVQADGKIVVAGQANPSSNNMAALRYNSDGTLDSSFGTAGAVSIDVGTNSDDRGQAMALQRDGKLLIAGTSTRSGSYDFAMVRLATDGSLDNRLTLSSSLGGTVVHTEDGSATVMDSNVTVFDAELAAAGSYSGATLSLTRQGGANGDDGFAASGTLGALTEGGNLVVGGVTVGTVTTHSGGTLLLAFNASATEARVNAVLQQLAYRNSNHNPPGSVTLAWSLADGNAGAQGSGGALAASGKVNVTITAANDAPVLADTALAITVAEDAGAPSGAVGVLVSALAGGISDADSGASSGIAVVATNPASGTWYYSTDGGGSWAAVGAVSPASSLLLAGNASTRLYLAPAANVNGTASAALTLRAWDQTSGAAGSKVSTLSTGGSTAFSTATDTLDVTITAVNDAPVLADTALALSVTEDAGPPSGAVGALVGAFTGGISDVDSGAVQGIALVGSDESHGTWHYSVDNGSTWQAVGALSPGSGLLLADDGNTRLYFTPSADWDSTDGSALTLRGWDRTSGAAGSRVDTTSAGGSSAFSAATDAVAVTATAVNDVPVSHAPASLTGTEDGGLQLTGLSVTDPDAGSSLLRVELMVLQGGLSATSGAGVTVLDSGSWRLSLVGNLSDLNAYLASGAAPVYTPDPNANGPVTLDMQTSDGLNTGTGGVVDYGRLDYRFQDGPVPGSDPDQVSPVGGQAGVVNDHGLGALATALSGSTTDFGVIYSGVFEIYTPGSYTFALNADDSARYVIDGTPLSLAFFGGASDTVALAAGLHTVELRYAQGTGGLGLVPTVVGPDTGGTVYDIFYLPGLGRQVSPLVSTTLNVAAANDAPVLANASLAMTVAEDAGPPSGAVGALVGAFTGGVSDVDSGAVKGIAITATDETHGTWHYSTNNGASWAAVGAVGNGSALLLADDGSTRLYFQPAADWNGSSTAALTLRAWDQTSGSAGTKVDASITGGTTAISAASDTVDVAASPVNDAPVLADTALSLTVTEDAGAPGGTVGALVSAFTGGLSDVDSGAVKGIAITASDEAHGSWHYSTDNGSTWTAVGTVSASSALLLADDGASRLYFRPAADFAGTASSALTLRGWDRTSGAAGTWANTSSNGGSSAFSSATDALDVSVIAVDDGPVFSGLDGAPAYTEDAAAVVLDANATLSDVELSAADNFSGATLTLQRQGGAQAQDLFEASGTLGALTPGGNLTVGATTIGTVSSNAAGTLSLSFNGAATQALVNSALQQIAYRNSSDAPPVSVQIDWLFSDGNAGGQGSGGALTTSGSTTVAISAANDAPVILGGSLILVSDTDEDTTSFPVQVDTAVTSAGHSDADGLAAAQGMAVTGVTGHGQWVYSTDGVSWTPVGTVSATQALLLGASSQLRYQPDQLNGEVATFSFRAWDNTSGAASANGAPVTANPGAGGGSSAFSTGELTVQRTVTDVNDAPVLADTALTITVAEDAGFPTGAVGSLVSAFTGGISDVDHSAVKGIAITATDESHGAWFYSTNSGSNWLPVGAVSDTSSLLLADDGHTRLYFAPTADWNGSSTAGLTLRAWDQTTGSHATKVDTSSTGGTTAFSTANDTAAVTVTAVNDAPVLADTALSITVAEDAGAPSGAVGSLVSAFTGGISDVDSGPVKGIAITATDESHGTWYYSTNNGSIWAAVGAVSGTSSLLLADDGSTRLYFSPSANWNGSSAAAVTLRGWDQTSGSAGSKVDTSANGGTTSFSSAADTVGVTVTPVNDVPVLADTALSLSVAEDAGAPAGMAGSLLSVFTGGISDVDSGPVKGIAITATDESHGTWYYSTNNGSIWAAVGAVSSTSSLLLADDGSTRLYFSPSANWNGSSAAALTQRGWDQTSGSAGSKVDTSVNGGTTSFSSAADTVDVTVTPVNDAPVLADTALSLSVAEDAGAPAGLVGSLVSALTGGVADVDSGAVKGIAITATDESHGTWYYSTNNGSIWAAVGAVSSTSSLLLADDGNTRLYFAPTADWNGSSTAALTLRAWDQTTGSHATKVDTSSTGGTTAFSTANDTVAVTVTAVNDAPVLADTALSITVAEDAGAPSGAVGSLVSAFTGGISDVDSGPVKCIAITATDESHGAWFYSTNNGSSWLPVGTVSDTSSLLLADDGHTRLYFSPAANWNGTSAGALTLRAWDQTTGSHATKVDTSSTGGTTAFSVAFDTVVVTVDAVNDPPVTTVPASVAVVEDQASPVTGISIADADLGTGSVVVTWSVPSGSLTASSGGGVTVGGTASALTLTGSASAINGFIAAGGVRYTTAADANGQVVLTVLTTDQGHTGNGGALTDTDQVTLAITPVNDAPTLASGAVVAWPGTDENTASTSLSVSHLLNSAGWADADLGALQGLAITAASGLGQWQYSADGLTWSGLGTVSPGQALLLGASAQLRYLPDGQNGESATLGVQAWDQTAGAPSTSAAPAYANTSASPGTAYSAQTALATLVVSPVNDAPRLTPGATVDLDGTDEDDASLPVTVASLLASAGWVDADAGALRGIAVTATSGRGSWQYSTDGLAWTGLGTIAGDQTVRLDAAAQLRYQPDGLNGESAGFSFRAWDQTDAQPGSQPSSQPGSLSRRDSTGPATASAAPARQPASQPGVQPARGTAQAGGNNPGDEPAYSAQLAEVRMVVRSVNDAPELNSGPALDLGHAAGLGAAAGVTVADLLRAGGWSDSDQSALTGVAVTATSGAGSWQYSVDDSPWVGFGSVRPDRALLLGPATQVRYVPNGGTSETASFDFRGWDQTSAQPSTGSAPSHADASSGGGRSSMSSVARTAAIQLRDQGSALPADPPAPAPGTPAGEGSDASGSPSGGNPGKGNGPGRPARPLQDPGLPPAGLIGSAAVGRAPPAQDSALPDWRGLFQAMGQNTAAARRNADAGIANPWMGGSLSFDLGTPLVPGLGDIDHADGDGRYRRNPSASGRASADDPAAPDTLASTAAPDNPGSGELLSPVAATGAAVSASLLWWLTRSSSMLASVLMVVPAWRHIDLLPVVARTSEDDDDDSDGLDGPDGTGQGDPMAGDAAEAWSAPGLGSVGSAPRPGTDAQRPW